MINFANGTVFNLKPIDMKSVNQNALRILINGEQPLCAFKTVRDQVLFTNKRIITIDVQGVTGKRQEVSTLPYSKIQYFSIQTPGFAELVPDSEMELFFSNGFMARFEFKGSTNIVALGKVISEYVL